MKLKPFKEMVALSKEKIDEAMAPIRARQVQAKAALEKSKLEADILGLEGQIQELCVLKDLPFDQLLDKLDEMGLLQRRAEQYDEVLEQLFPSKK